MRHARGGVDGVWFPVAEVGQHARQDGRNHVTVDGTRPIVRGELTPRGHAGTRGQPVRRAFAGIPIRVPEDPQGHDNHERDREHGQRQQRPCEHVALDGEEQDHRQNQREHAHHRADTRHEMAFLVRETFQQVRVPAQPYARLRDSNRFHASMSLRRFLRVSSSRSYRDPCPHVVP